MTLFSRAFSLGLWVGFAPLSLFAAQPSTLHLTTGREQPYYTPKNFVGDPMMPASIRRVVLLPVCAGNVATPESAVALDESLLLGLQKQLRFEVVTMSRDEWVHWFGAGEFLSTSPLPAGFLDKVAAKFAADAIIFVDLTAYQPYRPLSVGFRAKLATIHDVRLVWSFDEIVSSNDPGVANRARQQYRQMDRGDQPVDLSPSVLQSPGRFANFVADAMFQTLPPR